jgi:hypothetical protein
MFNALTLFGTGIWARSKCEGVLPRCSVSCSAKRKFKLGFCIHNASLTAKARGYADDQPVNAESKKRPAICVCIDGDSNRQRQTEPGDWVKKDSRWNFREVLTLEVAEDEDAVIMLTCKKQVDLVVAALAMGDSNMGEVVIPVSSIMPRMRLEEREFEGAVYVTEPIAFDLLKEGVKTGRALVSFEAKAMPPHLERLVTDIVTDN